MMLDVGPGVDEEKAAHRFAGAFLLPEEVLWAKVGRHRSDIDWKELLVLKTDLRNQHPGNHLSVQGPEHNQ